MEPGDIIIDGGNALYTDTMRREKAMRERGLRFVRAGISGGEEGALNGPSIMPGGPAGSHTNRWVRCSGRSPRMSTACRAPTLARTAPGTSSNGPQRHRVLRHTAHRVRPTS
ncbi:NAD(P)-binding domain-containing protein [Mycobacterium tuberculosis]|uniref:NAD(P)-binding domain-containing protein n=1 Tax=Mycobacterium tuberculosis TaxID=1773 RepID=UPI0032B5D875